MTRLPSRLVAWLLCLAAVLATPGAAPPYARAQKHEGQDSSTRLAKQHFYRGEKLFALGRFDDALAEYEAAFEAKPLPEFLFNIGQCHRNLGSYEKAIFSFRLYLSKQPEARNRAAVEALIKELEEKSAEERRRQAAAAARQRRRTPRPPPPPPTPFYKQWWFWTGVAAAAAAGTAAVLLIDNGSGLPETDLGNLDFRK